MEAELRQKQALEAKLKFQQEKKEEKERMKRTIEIAASQKKDFYSNLNQKKINMTDDTTLKSIDAQPKDDVI